MLREVCAYVNSIFGWDCPRPALNALKALSAGPAARTAASMPVHKAVAVAAAVLSPGHHELAPPEPRNAQQLANDIQSRFARKLSGDQWTMNPSSLVSRRTPLNSSSADESGANGVSMPVPGAMHLQANNAQTTPTEAKSGQTAAGSADASQMTASADAVAPASGVQPGVQPSPSPDATANATANISANDTKPASASESPPLIDWNATCKGSGCLWWVAGMFALMHAIVVAVIVAVYYCRKGCGKPFWPDSMGKRLKTGKPKKPRDGCFARMGAVLTGNPTEVQAAAKRRDLLAALRKAGGNGDASLKAMLIALRYAEALGDDPPKPFLGMLVKGKPGIDGSQGVPSEVVGTFGTIVGTSALGFTVKFPCTTMSSAPVDGATWHTSADYLEARVAAATVTYMLEHQIEDNAVKKAGPAVSSEVPDEATIPNGTVIVVRGIASAPQKNSKRGEVLRYDAGSER